MSVLKEELKLGKGMKVALKEGYGNAFSAIFDSNLTSLITGVILLVTGTGPIRGFRYHLDHWSCYLILHCSIPHTYRI